MLQLLFLMHLQIFHIIINQHNLKLQNQVNNIHNIDN